VENFDRDIYKFAEGRVPVLVAVSGDISAPRATLSAFRRLRFPYARTACHWEPSVTFLAVRYLAGYIIVCPDLTYDRNSHPHDDEEVLRWIFNHLEVGNRIALLDGRSRTFSAR